LPIYFSNAVDLESILPSFQALSSTENEKAIGADLDSTVFNAKLMLMMSQLGVLSPGSLQAAENQVSPEGLSALFQTGFEGALSRAALVDQRLSQFRDAQQSRGSAAGFSQSGTPLFAGNLTPVEEASVAAPQREGDWSGFVSGNGGLFNVAGDSNAAGYQVTTYGLTGAGADIRLSRDFALGLMAGFTQSNISLDGSGTLTAAGGQLGLYGLFAMGGFYADGLVEGGIDQYTSLRQSYVGTATGQTQGQEWSGAMELGYGWKVDPVTLGPMASLQYTRVGLNGFSESGSLSPLTYPTQSQDSFQSHLGLQIDGHWNLGSAVLSPEIIMAWEHEYDDLGGNVEAGFGTGDSFTVAGPALGQNGVLAGVGVDLAFSKNFSVDLRYQGELNRTELDSQQFGGGIRLGF
ncbi:MAG TPA: autotransporter outer membrane beta-barrel domain-containing protein, partial [bacterium]|nr:autotransporter outer membrane beta-barrel domain-containing protein [bacterium]